MLFEWSHFDVHISFKGDHRFFFLPLIIDEDFDEGGTELDRPLVCNIASCKMLSEERIILSKSMSNPTKECVVKGLQNTVKPLKEIHDSF